MTSQTELASTGSLSEHSRAKRPHRVSIFEQRKMPEYSREGYHPCYVNDTPGNIGAYEAAGYTKVVKDGEPVRLPVDSRHGIEAVLMEVPMEFYLEDQASLEKDALAKDAKIVSEATSGKNRYGQVTMNQEH